MPALLRNDRNLAWYLVARSLSAIGAAGTAFYTVYALQAWQLPAAAAGMFTALMLLGTIAGTLVLGWLADHAGHRVVLLAGVVASVAGNAIALAAASPGVFSVAFVLAGVQSASVTISGLNVLLEFAPAVETQPTYVGLGHTSGAPAAFVAPLIGGVLADAAGFSGAFVFAALGGTAAMLLLALRVRDPRHVRALTVVSRA
jgi:MFS family permease